MGNFIQGLYKIENLHKYAGNPNKCKFRSSWERVLMKKFDHSPQVISWVSETIAVEYINKLTNGYHRYYPDFLVKLRKKDGTVETVMIEVKPFVQTRPPISKRGKNKARLITEQKTYVTNMSKWESAMRYCKKKGWRFVIMTEKEIFGKGGF